MRSIRFARHREELIPPLIFVVGREGLEDRVEFGGGLVGSGHAGSGWAARAAAVTAAMLASASARNGMTSRWPSIVVS